jgi:hypothetical protein
MRTIGGRYIDHFRLGEKIALENSELRLPSIDIRTDQKQACLFGDAGHTCKDSVEFQYRPRG